VVEHTYWHAADPMIVLIGKWYVFWAAGVRLFIAGVRQIVQPKFTSEKIFGIKSDDPLPIVRELGIANLATGTVGLLSLWLPSFVLPVAIAATIFYGAAGLGHLFQAHRNRQENIAMISDLLASLVFAASVLAPVLGQVML
jgi:uncharacterized membrane protein HdeD (DUF308 family)